MDTYAYSHIGILIYRETEEQECTAVTFLMELLGLAGLKPVGQAGRLEIPAPADQPWLWNLASSLKAFS